MARCDCYDEIIHDGVVVWDGGLGGPCDCAERGAKKRQKAQRERMEQDEARRASARKAAKEWEETLKAWKVVTIEDGRAAVRYVHASNWRTLFDSLPKGMVRENRNPGGMPGLSDPGAVVHKCGRARSAERGVVGKAQASAEVTTILTQINALPPSRAGVLVDALDRRMGSEGDQTLRYWYDTLYTTKWITEGGE